MMTSLESQQAARHSAIVVCLFLCLWGVLVLVDRIVIGVDYSYSVHDLEIGWFSWMLNWSTGDPRLVWYSPAVIPRMLNGLVSLFISVDYSAKPIEKFIWIGIILQGLFVAICAFWFSWITRMLCIRWFEQLFLIFLFFCFPTLLQYVGHRGFYLEFWLIGLPLGLTLYAALTGNSKADIAAGAGCGFLVANYYPSAAVVVAFVVVLLGQRVLDSERTTRKLFGNLSSFLPMSRAEYYLMLWLGLCAIAWIIGINSTPLNDAFTPDNILTLVFVGSFSWLASYGGLVVITRLNLRLEKFVLWFIGGFVLFSSIFLPWYWHGLISVSGQTIGYWQSFVLLWTQVVANPWFAVIWYFLAALIGLLIYHLWMKISVESRPTKTFGPITFAVIGTLAVMAVAGATKGSIPGSAERGLTAVAPMFAVGIMAFSKIRRRYWRILFVVPMIVISGYAVADFYRAYHSAIKEQILEGSVLDEAINNFLEEQKDGAIVCVAEEYYSKYCAAAYAYNRYRTSTSDSKLPSRVLFGGRVVSINTRMPNQKGNWDDSNEIITDLLFPVSRPLLVVTKGGWFRDNLIGLFESEGHEIMPFWRWWADLRQKQGKSVTNVAPGEMFIVSFTSEN